ncbi:uncharacterized protein C8Q71DRAFT_472226 [Rhodofomes roseus]|uniref:Uncharacterized protein n=1 Tax=Rhodofomes roseus TaxID=34475 RepID=A0ABQ8KP95_9APHY|nr:uncharacterized protein C8Q71DRAFT_472226 [Rhodofomes roseus]KAH9839983.1 hypothetical protein C8Q71DRAFT_472226 [Rhodofomes roseus]
MLLTLRLSVTPQYIMAALVACFGLAARTASLRGTGIWCSVCKSLWLHSGRASFPVGYHRPWVRNHKWDSISELLIAYRIWRVERAATSVLSLDATSLTRAIIILVESCAVCFVFLLLLIGTYAARSPVMFIILDMTSPVNMSTYLPLADN